MIIYNDNGYKLWVEYEEYSAGVTIYTFLIYEFTHGIGVYKFLFLYQLVVLPTQTIRIMESRNYTGEIEVNEVKLDEWDKLVPKFEIGTAENIKEVFMKFINTEINLIGEDSDNF